MSLECGYCEHDLRGGHARDCILIQPEYVATKKRIAKLERALEMSAQRRHVYQCDLSTSFRNCPASFCKAARRALGRRAKR